MCVYNVNTCVDMMMHVYVDANDSVNVHDDAYVDEE